MKWQKDRKLRKNSSKLLPNQNTLMGITKRDLRIWPEKLLKWTGKYREHTHTKIKASANTH